MNNNDFPSLGKFHEFSPELIVEATSVCDQNCAGCYAGNVISKADSNDLVTSDPTLFLRPTNLKTALDEIIAKNQTGMIISIRGGEPSRHPRLNELLQIVSERSTTVYLETHGRWILATGADANELLKSVRDTRTIVKISFDRMHGMKPELLGEIIQIMDAHGIKWVVAITESSEARFAETRSKIPFVSTDKIIVQKFASTLAGLIKPKIGVITTTGKIANSLTSRLPDLRKPAKETEQATS